MFTFHVTCCCHLVLLVPPSQCCSSQGNSQCALGFLPTFLSHAPSLTQVLEGPPLSLTLSDLDLINFPLLWLLSMSLLLRICFVLPWSADLFRWCRFLAGSRALRPGLDTEAAWIKKKTAPFAAAVLEGTGTPSKQICTRGILSRPFRGFRQKDKHCFWQSVLWWYHLGGCHYLFGCVFCCPWAKHQPAYLCVCSTNSLKTWSHQTQGHDPLLICL